MARSSTDYYTWDKPLAHATFSRRTHFVSNSSHAGNHRDSKGAATEGGLVQRGGRKRPWLISAKATLQTLREISLAPLTSSDEESPQQSRQAPSRRPPQKTPLHGRHCNGAGPELSIEVQDIHAATRDEDFPGPVSREPDESRACGLEFADPTTRTQPGSPSPGRFEDVDPEAPSRNRNATSPIEVLAPCAANLAGSIQGNDAANPARRHW